MQAGYLLVQPWSIYLAQIPPGLTPETPSGKRNSRFWTEQEDLLLLQAISKYGTNDWNSVVRAIGTGRTRGQCSQRWYRCLDPNIIKGHWEPEEDEKLIQIVSKYPPNNWAHVARDMANRTDIQCRHRYLYIKRMNLIPAEQRDALPPISRLLATADSSEPKEFVGNRD
jgi:hypothetical protein